MVDEIISNLEPINDDDLNMKEKFVGNEKLSGIKLEKSKIEEIKSQEKKSEKKEGVIEKEKTYSKILAKVPSQAKTLPKDDIVADDAKQANEELDAEGKLNKLIELAQTKGVFHAVSVAKHMENYYLLDEFHDRLLADELHDALVKKGLIKEI